MKTYEVTRTWLVIAPNPQAATQNAQGAPSHVSVKPRDITAHEEVIRPGGRMVCSHDGQPWPCSAKRATGA